MHEGMDPERFRGQDSNTVKSPRDEAIDFRRTSEESLWLGVESVCFAKGARREGGRMGAWSEGHVELRDYTR